VWLLSTAHKKTQGERNDLKSEFIIKMVEQHKDLENSQPGHIKNKKHS
jgi:hypothetical protein